jgi:hypothetical protein
MACIGANGIVLTSCCSDDVTTVTVAFRSDIVVTPSYAWLGDTISMQASAYAQPVLFNSCLLYTSWTNPELFRYNSTAPAVATVDRRGLFTARALGVTTLQATSAGIKGYDFPVVVAPAFASLRVTATPALARVGDTIVIRVDALDGDNAPIAGAQVQGAYVPRPSDTLVTWVPSGRPYPPFPSYTFPTPVIDRLVLRHPGVFAVWASAPHDAGKGPWYAAESTFVTVTAP